MEFYIIILFCCCFGIGNCFPMTSAPQIGEQRAFIFGALAFISIGAFLGACVCCRRRKRGFEEFENESGALESARTEYPIFRPISSPERTVTQNESIIQVANAHIIGINENNIQINEEVDNNNGPLSPADMENIENNNAVDYIPNRNEIERLDEPASIFFEQEQHQSPIFDRLNPFDEEINNCSDNAPVSNRRNPFVNIIKERNFFTVCDGNQYGEDALVIKSNNAAKSSVKLLDEAVSLESSLSEKSATDVNSVEEALRALDFAISGEESLLQPNDDDFEFEDYEGVNSSFNNVMKNFLITNAANEVISETTKVYDENNIEDIRKEAELLVNSIIEECEERIERINNQIDENELLFKTLNMTQPIEMVNHQVTINDNIQEYDNCTTNAIATVENCTTLNDIDLDLVKDVTCVGSIENLCFENLVLEASTPFVKAKREIMGKYFRNESPSVTISHQGGATFDMKYNKSEAFGSSVHGVKQLDELGLLDLSGDQINSTLTNEINGTFIKSEKVKKHISTDSLSFIKSPVADGTFNTQFKELEIIDTKSINAVKRRDETTSLDPLANANQISTTFINSMNKTFVREPEIGSELKFPTDCPTIKIDKEDTTSIDMTTVTPVNTPSELNYSLDSWDKFISNSIAQTAVTPNHIVEMQPCTSSQAGFSSFSGWFLHPKTDDADSPNTNDTFDVDEEYGENMDSTFDALRKQLAIILPFAQGVTEQPPEFSDDEDDNSDEKVEHFHASLEPHTEMVINYKRPLSPIMEESEDETCKTFVMNETKNLDSTSTGCVETGEAIMGVTKTLMASNDTLFNFEDTLGDDVFSPRANSQNDVIRDTKTNHPDTSGASTPTPRSFKPIDFEPVDVCNVNDLLSPDQQKTLSEDICTVEHLSSDAVDTTFTTNTLDEKTCISVYIKEDEKISEISEPDWESSNQCDLNSLNDIPSMGGLDNDDDQTQSNQVEIDDSSSTVSTPKKDEKINQDHPNVEIVPSFHHNDDESHKETTNFLRNEINYSASHNNKSLDAKTIIDENIKENTDPNAKRQYDGIEASQHSDENTILLANNLTESGIFEGDLLCETDVIMRSSTFHPADITIDLNKHQSIIPNFTLIEIDPQGDQNCVMMATEIINQLSGEEDPWAHPMSAIRFTGPCAEIMSTSFTGNEWDSDIDDSNSSEEFMYVKGTPPKVPSPELYKLKLENKYDKKSLVPIIVEEDIGSVWNSHEDKVPVSINEIAETNLENFEDSSSDAEGEWVPSSWDSLAQPSRSALKSPDKSSSSPKKRRSVAFKKQNYHSVYEYPKEVVSLSPSYSEPQLWVRDLNDLFENSTEPVDVKITETDGFNVSSSTRPFHGSQFNAQCHTWPTDTNFSWSQIQENESNHDKCPSYSELQIKWPKDLKDFFCSEEAKDNTDIELARPDSGVGESAELLSDAVTLGDLCHTKASLRLPLNKVPAATSETNKITDFLNNQSTDQNNLILPTPSCTGSMDSLSSSSGSERQISFSTFGKSTSISLDDDRINESDSKSELLIIDDDKLDENECPVAKQNHDQSTKQNDSTDEDSGIESIMRIANEKM